ncbi:MAG: copper amine oxidase N-terminal domain-containing protein, partial [bacterium]|nr:copper amine oxidase N-terminal domain-containing protein [bacterium]
MKRIVSILILFSIIFSVFNIASGNNDSYIDLNRSSIDLDNKDNIMWTGKEWITTTYPPSISADKTNFTEMPGNSEVKSILKNFSVGYLWTGDDYLVYHISHDYRQYNNDKYLYRLSSDMSAILNTYKIPNWINYIYMIDNVCYIATENVRPVYISGTERIGGERRNEFEVYCSDDFETWSKFDFDFDIKHLGYRPAMYTSDDRLLIVDYYNPELKQYTQQSRKVWMYSTYMGVNEIVYEMLKPMQIKRCGPLYYTQLYDTEHDKSSLAFSKDGVYWTIMSMAELLYMEDIYENGSNIIIKSVVDNKIVYDYCEKETLYNQIEDELKDDAIYIKFNNSILAFEQSPIIEDERTLVPMRFLFEQMGACVDWNAETQSATATLDNTAVTFAVNDTKAEVNSQPVTMDVPAQLINGKTMVPLRFLSEELGYT